MTVATIIYYTGLHPYTLRPVYTARTPQEKKRQHLFFFWHKRENHQEIREKLKAIDREDLIEKLIGDKKKHNKRTILNGRHNDHVMKKYKGNKKRSGSSKKSR